MLDIITRNRARYMAIGNRVAVPWEIVACIHNLECGLSFDKCLHNGQKWWKKTTWVPKGLGPWESFETAAIDALARKRRPKHWNIANTLYFLEKYNGLGYRKYHPTVLSPYLWSGTNHYVEGKYVSDGKFSYSAVSSQYGAATLLKLLNWTPEA